MKLTDTTLAWAIGAASVLAALMDLSSHQDPRGSGGAAGERLEVGHEAEYLAEPEPIKERLEVSVPYFGSFTARTSTFSIEGGLESSFHHGCLLSTHPQDIVVIVAGRAPGSAFAGHSRRSRERS